MALGPQVVVKRVITAISFEPAWLPDCLHWVWVLYSSSCVGREEAKRFDREAANGTHLLMVPPTSPQTPDNDC